MARNLSRFKREVKPITTISANRIRATIDPRSRYIRDLYKDIDEVNKMLDALAKKGYENMWSSKILLDRLEQSNMDVVRNNRISKKTINKSRNMTNLTAIKRAINDFIDNPISTTSGLDKRVKSYRDTIAQYTDSREFANKLSDEEVYQFYELFSDPNMSTIMDKIDPSDIYVIGINTLKEGTNKKDFLNIMSERGYDVNDIELGLALNSMYDKLMSIRNR